ncbi:dCTP pyrophosphatase 1 [Lemmus lemmus]
MLKDLGCLHAKFATEQNWEQFHQPQNCYQFWWVKWASWQNLFWGSLMQRLVLRPGCPSALQGELSEVLLISLVAFTACYHVALPQTVVSKMDANQLRYPIHLSAGSACKCTDLPHWTIFENQAVGAADPTRELKSQASI